ncbi:phospholipid:diacylglycerol acyltransferase 2 [Dorcoceras hygrometricum]|uniref:Phospholipid:diacylglycerol acyltransferase 2 n=1 Tax=Dorcoceras hygrometricum TaxID=472368 RepID=A0A2Z7C6T4_9LAMI|nr:phospholipid:diacylglycerol acyltransferase 2 [Dorcoceras hygrometricum]
MASNFRLRKLCSLRPVKFSSNNHRPETGQSKFFGTNSGVKDEKLKQNKLNKQWRCIDSCCWTIGYLCITWWLLLFLYHCLPANWQGFKGPEPPGERLRRSGTTALHPVVLVPGIVTGGLELWEGRPCSDGLFRKRLWGGSFTEVFKRPMCWLEHLSLNNETGLDPPGIRVRAVPGLVEADYFAPGYFVWANLIQNFARIGYEEKNMYMAAYDWRLSFQNTETRDQALSRLKSKIELMYVTNGHKKVVVVPHSMGAIYFLHFIKWVEAPPPMGGGGGADWCAKYIKAIMNIGPTFLGVPKIVGSLLSVESKDLAFIRTMAPRLVDAKILGLHTLEHVTRVSRTWDSIVSLLPKGGEAIWGNLDWSPEENYVCASKKEKNHRSFVERSNTTNDKSVFEVQESTKYGRIISFGKRTSELHSSELPTFNSQEHALRPDDTVTKSYPPSSEKVWTDYDEVSGDSIYRIFRNSTFTAKTLLDLLRSIAPIMMKRAEAQFSHGMANNLDDHKYKNYKYWSNPLETKLPDAPHMEIYCLYGVGIPTERSYIYKLSPSSRRRSIPLQIDSSADGNHNGCLKGGVFFVDGDGTVPVLSSGFMCAKGWRGKTRFNPSRISTYVREYKHQAPANLLEGRGITSSTHVDIMGNVALVEDILRVAAGAPGVELGGDKIHSDIVEMSKKVRTQL